MLVLRRKKLEAIRIGDVQVMIIDVIGTGSATKVRLGIDAPREVPVHREEVWRLLKQQSEK
jgi:carbon storage regulator